LPLAARQPDILINSYSTNGMHFVTLRYVVEGGVIIQQQNLNVMQFFVRTAVKVTVCTPDETATGLLQNNQHRPLWMTLLAMAFTTFSIRWRSAKISRPCRVIMVLPLLPMPTWCGTWSMGIPLFAALASICRLG
jgi:hypothetical protein